MVRLIQATNPDLAHVHNIYHHISPSILDALHESGLPIVMTLHDYKLICPVHTLWRGGVICERCEGKRFYHCAVQRCNHGSLLASTLNALEAYVHAIMRIYSHVDLFIAPSRFLRNKHIAFGMAPDRIVHVPNFIDLAIYSPCFESDAYFAFVGRLMPHKGLGTLLEAASQVGGSARLLVIGDGPIRGHLETLARRLRLRAVDFLGFRSGQELRELIARARFVVVPSEWYENCPYVILEAFALGTPVVASAIGGIPELVQDRVNGMLFDPGSVESLAAALAFAARAPRRLSEMARAARHSAESQYGEEGHAAQLSRVYSLAGAHEL
jgi:glycosyltransferase involved in cell wall biosynthesis